MYTHCSKPQQALQPRALVRALHIAFISMPLLALLPAATHVHAQSTTQAQDKRDYQIPGGSLASVLMQFSATAGIELSVDATLVQGLNSQGLSGTHTVASAFATLLGSSGLEAMQRGNKQYTLTRPSNDKTLPTIVSQAPSTYAPEATEGTGSYTTATTNSATRMTMSLRETPQSISVFTRQKMDDLGIQSIEELANNTPGVSLNKGSSERASFNSRGFSISNFAVDGIPTSSNSDVLSHSTLSIYDRVEVLRGSTGMLIGPGNPSGVINLMRKRPTKETQVSISGSAGTWSNYRGELDAGGALNAAGTLRARTVVSHQDSNTFNSNYKHHRNLFYGIIEADLTSRTLLTTGITYNKERNPGSNWYGLPYDVNGAPVITDPKQSITPDWAYWDKENLNYFASINHRFDNDWKATLSYNYFNNKLDSLVNEATFDSATRLLTISNGSSFLYEHQQHSLDANLTGPFSLLGRRHELVVGASYSDRDQFNEGVKDPTGVSYTFDPVNWNTQSLPSPNMSAFTRFWGTTVKIKQSAVYSTARFNLTDKLNTIVGARLDWYEYEGSNLLTGLVTSTYKVNNEFTPYAGITYDLNKQHTAYASVTSIFSPQSAVDRNGQLLDPVTGINYETGIKGEYFDGAMNVSAAIFQIKQQNRARSLLVSECSPGVMACSEAAGEVESKGFDLEATGALTPNWNISAGYSYKTAEYTKSDSASNPVGKRFATNSPDKLVRVATSYRLPGELSAVRIGGSVQSQGPIYNGLQRHGGYTISNLMAAWAVTRQLDLRLNINNVFNKHYYQSIGGFGEPRNLLLSARYTF